MAEVRRVNGFAVTAEEARFLRRFVRRELLPWLAGVGALSGLALALALAPAEVTSPAAIPVVERVAPETHGLRVDVAAELRSENARLRADLTALQRAVEAGRSVPAASIAADSHRAQARGDLDSIRERLYNLETRQDSGDRESSALQQDLLARLFSLERSSGSEAAARLENLDSGEQRFEKLERRLYQIEQHRDASNAPAAPASSE